MAFKYNLTIDQGSCFELYVVLFDETEEAININNYEINAKMKKWYSSSTYIPFEIIKMPELSLFNMRLSSQQTEEIAAGRYVYDIELSEITTNVSKRIVEGIVTVTPEVTN